MTNRLAEASSAYLRSAAHQPVSWHPWGPEAFDAARRTGRPMLLDIGAVWCHWCHVMDHESYEDPLIAAYLNEHFVCLKVDRDERPDVDARYQRAVQAITGQGGWPLTAFLSPDGEVFYGGTYFPPENQHGRPGFRTVLEQVHRFWQEHRDRALQQASSLRGVLEARADRAMPGSVTAASLLTAERNILAETDPAYGGFGSAPKFPHPGTLRWLLSRWADGASGKVRHVAEEALRGMNRGGIHDQLAGGFHRYSVDRQWIIPHFEKMSYDNSELLRAFTWAGVLTGDAEYLAAARGIVRWVRQDLAHPDAGYATSQDADIGPEDDGSYFTWTRDEVSGLLDADQLEVVLRRFGLGTAGAMPHDPVRNVLFLARTPGEVAHDTGRSVGEVERLLVDAVAAMTAARMARRPVPTIDRTRYVSWNAMMAGALLGAAPVLRDSWARDHALATLAWLRRLGGSGRLPHLPGGVGGMLEDQVHTADAAIDAFETTGDTAFLEWAVTIMDAAWEDFWDPVEGGCFDLARGREAGGLLDTGLKPIQDAPVPSGNGVAGIVMARLHGHTGEGRWAERHRSLVEAFAGRAPGLGLFGTAWLMAADWLLNPIAHLVVTGSEGDPVAEQLHQSALAAPLPRRLVRRLWPGQPCDGLPPEMRGMLGAGGEPRGYLCVGARCLPPAGDPDQWGELLREAQGRFRR
jgi:uncharacterized protein YyaL (SSP411 family)